MDRRALAELAAETVALVRAGRYGSLPPSVLYLPSDSLPAPGPAGDSAVEVSDETTLAAAARLAAAGLDPVACLNFASATKPGGGYLSGAVAQEESLARASALAIALESAPEYYAYHRRHRDLRYSDRVIYSPGVPVFRDDAGRLVPPYRVAFLTAAAPNVRAMPGPADVSDVLRVRAGRVLAVAYRHGHQRLVLGAWGCGVFGNDPGQVAAAFAAWLGPGGGYAGRFDRVVFAIPDPANRRSFGRTFDPPR